jgi:hypothetical protein
MGLGPLRYRVPVQVDDGLTVAPLGIEATACHPTARVWRDNRKLPTPPPGYGSHRRSRFARQKNQTLRERAHAYSAGPAQPG